MSQQKNIISYWLWFTIIVCPFFYCNSIASNYLVAKQIFFQTSILIIFIIAFYFYGFSLFSYDNKMLFFSSICFLCYGFFSSLLSPSPFIALPKVILFLSFFLMFILLQKFTSSSRKVYLGWIIIVDIIALVSLSQWLQFPLVKPVHPGFYGSFLGNPNLLAHLIVSTMIVIIGHIIRNVIEGDKKQKNSDGYFLWFHIISFILLGFVLFITGSRGGVISFVVGLFFFGVWQKRGWKVLVVVLTTLLIFSLLPVFQGRTMWNKEISVYGSTEERLLIWNCSYQALQKNSHGYGFEQWQTHAWQIKEKFIRKPGNEIYLQHADNIFFTHAHCDYLELLLEIGIFGGLLFLFFICSFMIRIYKVTSKSKNILCKAHFAAIIATFAHATISFPLQTTVGLLTLTLHCYFLLPSQNTKSFESTKNINLLLVLLGFFFLLIITISYAVSMLK